MGKPTGFLEYTRQMPTYQEPQKRLRHYDEFVVPPDASLVHQQAARCMDCGVPFCHHGCPLGNIIPEFNDAVYKEQWEEAFHILSSTNNFPEFTGRICPAPCESACVLGINQPPVAIEFIEKSIIEKAFDLGWITPCLPEKKTGKRVAIIGSGPSGLAAAVQLHKAGHRVVVFERAEAAGGLLRYGIPDFKLSKKVVQRRIDWMKASGIDFKLGTPVGGDVSATTLMEEFDALVLAIGSTIPRDVHIPGRELEGVHFAMDFLSQQNSRNAGRANKNHRGELIPEIWATGKRVVVIGGGDTGSDCVGTSNRHGATSVTQLEVMEKPPTGRSEKTPWPMWPYMLRTSSSHEEGAERVWACAVQKFVGKEGKLCGLLVKDMGWVNDASGNPKWQVLEGKDREIPCELALLAVGFLHPQREGLVEQLALKLDERGNIVTGANYQSSQPKVFVAGDCRRGQSLVVWAISEGRECAYNVDAYLMGTSLLEKKDSSLSSSLV